MEKYPRLVVYVAYAYASFFFEPRCKTQMIDAMRHVGHVLLWREREYPLLTRCVVRWGTWQLVQDGYVGNALHIPVQYVAST